MAFRLRYLLAAAILVVAGWWFTRAEFPRAAPPSRGTTVVAFGDSLVSGRGTTGGRDFVSLLARRLNTRIVNAGRSGDTTATALERLDRDVLALNPRIVIVLLGGNDFLRRVPKADTFRNLDAIVTRIRERGAAVVITGVSLGLVSDEYGRDYEALARRRSAGFVPDILGGIFGRADLMADAIHPNDRGHEVMAGRLEPVLRELLARSSTRSGDRQESNRTAGDQDLRLNPPGLLPPVGRAQVLHEVGENRLSDELFDSRRS